MDSINTPEERPFAVTLSDEELGNLMFIVNSPAYTEFYRPFLIGMLRGFYHDLADPTGARKWGKPDDYLRGGIAVVRALLAFPDEAFAEARADKEAEAGLKTDEESYQERADAGHIGPMAVADDEEY